MITNSIKKIIIKHLKLALPPKRDKHKQLSTVCAFLYVCMPADVRTWWIACPLFWFPGFPPPIISCKSQHAVSWNSYLFCQFCLTSKLPKLLPRFRLVSPNCNSPTHLLLYSTSSHFYSRFSFPSRLDFSPAFISQFLCLAILSSHNGKNGIFPTFPKHNFNHWPWMRLKIRRGSLKPFMPRWSICKSHDKSQ